MAHDDGHPEDLDRWAILRERVVGDQELERIVFQLELRFFALLDLAYRCVLELPALADSAARAVGLESMKDADDHATIEQAMNALRTAALRTPFDRDEYLGALAKLELATGEPLSRSIDELAELDDDDLLSYAHGSIVGLGPYFPGALN